MLLIELLAAVLLPPLAVFLRAGIGPAFWIAVVVTILFWVPGIVFALVVLLAPGLLPARWTTSRN